MNDNGHINLVPHLFLQGKPVVVVVAGVSGAGKSMVGAALARGQGWPFQDGDALHPLANIARMRAGLPLREADRAPWLGRVAGWIAHRAAAGEAGVVACSALRASHRERLRQAGGAAARLVLLDPPEAVLRDRLAVRTGHFMPASLLGSQLATLERPGPDEAVLLVTGAPGVAETCERIVAWLAGPDEGQAPD